MDENIRKAIERLMATSENIGARTFGFQGTDPNPEQTQLAARAELEERIRSAVRTEREACAKVADGYARDVAGTDATMGAAWSIAERIRERE